jgi:hypothetical protein
MSKRSSPNTESAGRPHVTSYDSGYEFSLEHWQETRRVVEQEDQMREWNLDTKENVREAIRCRAYERYEQRGREHGRDLDDWFCAEAEVLTRFGAAA